MWRRRPTLLNGEQSGVQKDDEGDGECAHRLAPGVLHSEARPEEVGSDIRFL